MLADLPCISSAQGCKEQAWISQATAFSVWLREAVRELQGQCGRQEVSLSRAGVELKIPAKAQGLAQAAGLLKSTWWFEREGVYTASSRLCLDTFSSRVLLPAFFTPLTVSTLHQISATHCPKGLALLQPSEELSPFVSLPHSYGAQSWGLLPGSI